MELEAAWHVICESRVTDFEGSKLLASLDVLIHAGKQVDRFETIYIAYLLYK